MTSTFISQQRPFLIQNTFRAQSIYHPQAFAPTKIKFGVLLIIYFFLKNKIRYAFLGRMRQQRFGRHDQTLGCE